MKESNDFNTVHVYMMGCARSFYLRFPLQNTKFFFECVYILLHSFRHSDDILYQRPTVKTVAQIGGGGFDDSIPRDVARTASSGNRTT